jgi:pimeloyl-ACP methyl ester carboxylesterase
MQTFKNQSTGTTIQLRDGRTLGYAQYGDPAGKPLIFMHGFPDSHITRHPDDALTASLGVRLIIPDRPGIGLSSFKPARSLVERVEDVVELADLLKLPRFAVLGWSAGGPYALACAFKIPDRLTAVGVACGFAPLDRPGALAGMTREMKQFIPMLRRMPWMARLFMVSLPRQYQKNPERAFNKQFGTALSAADAQVMARPEIHANLLEGAVEAMRQGSRGPSMEMQLLFAYPWGFRPEDIPGKVSLWYGDADALVPLQMGHYLANILPYSNLTICQGEGHMLYVPRWTEILKTLTA